MNIGNPREMTIKQFAEEIIRIIGSGEGIAGIEYKPLPVTTRRCASPTSRARRACWDGSRKSIVDEGIRKTIDYFRSRV